MSFENAVRYANLTRLKFRLDLVANSVETIQDSRCHKMSLALQRLETCSSILCKRLITSSCKLGLDPVAA